MMQKQIKASTNLTPEETNLYRTLLFEAVDEEHGQPFLSKAFRRLIPVSAPGSKKLTIDRNWRVYIDFQHTEQVGLKETLSQLHHSIWHLLRDHQNRTTELPSAPQGYDKEQLANFAADLEINDDIVDLLPSDAFIPGEGYFSHYRKNDTLENYYTHILSELPQLQEDFSNVGESLESSEEDQQDNSEEQSNQTNSSEGQEDETDSIETMEEDSESEKSDTSSDSESQSDNDQVSENNPENVNDGQSKGKNQENDQKGPEDAANNDIVDEANDSGGDNSDSEKTSSSIQTLSQSGFPQQHKAPASSAEETAEVEESQLSDSNSESEQKNQLPECGEAAGNPDLYDLGENEAETMSESEEEHLLQEIAADIEEWEKENKGVGSGQSKRRSWAKKKLATKYISWKQELRGAFKQSFALTRGKLTYARNRPARRQPVPDVMYPALRAPQPTLGIGIDVSGSNLSNLTTVLHEIVKITQAANVRGKNVEAFAVDVKAAEPVIVNNPLKILDSFPVGGGTRMTPGYKKLAEMAKDVSLLITDGYVSDFPSKTPTHPGKPRTKFLTCIILPERNQDGDFLIKTAEKAVGSWSKVIPIYTSELKEDV